jgi:hypothetical protein
MASDLEGREDSENQRNLERFSPLMYQLKKSGNSNSNNHSQRNEIVGQEPGAYAYPSGDKRSSPNSTASESEDIIMRLRSGKLFSNQRLL